MEVDIFKRSHMKRFFDGVKNSCIFCLNVLFPHFDEKYLIRGIKHILLQRPSYLVLGGGVPMFEQMINGHYLPGWHTRVFKINEDYSFELLGHTVDGLVKVTKSNS